MATYSEWEQRKLDQESGAEMDRRAARKRRPAIDIGSYTYRGHELVVFGRTGTVLVHKPSSAGKGPILYQSMSTEDAVRWIDHETAPIVEKMCALEQDETAELAAIARARLEGGESDAAHYQAAAAVAHAKMLYVLLALIDGHY
jgi:hypothetical protein